jgi:hypothetical protein
VDSVVRKRKPHFFNKFEIRLKQNRMITETQIRSQLIRRIQRIPSDKLSELLSRLERTSTKKDKNLSFAGTWANIDQDTFDSLTENLLDNHQSNKR